MTKYLIGSKIIYVKGMNPKTKGATTMNLYIKWRYPDDTKEYAHPYYDIDPASIRISYGFLYFEEKGNPKNHWTYPLDHIIEMEQETQKTYFEIGYETDGIFSINMVYGDESSSEAYAHNHAKKYGYTLSYIIPITEARANENKAKGMPLTAL